MNVTNLTYAQTNAFSNTVTDYIDQKEELSPFYQFKVNTDEIPSIIDGIKSSNKLNRSTLVKELKNQYRKLKRNEHIHTNIDLLVNENSFTITTAHQLNILTGPLYYIYKIVNTIRVSKDLKALYPTYNFIPCYWMGSEDHDFEEVNHTYLFQKKISWDNFQGGSMGEYDTDGIAAVIDEAKEILRSGEHLEEIITTLKNAYAQSNLADAVRQLLQELFGDYGLVVIDGNCKDLKTPFSAIVKDELANHTSEKLVNNQIEDLASVGYKSQANPRPINLFYKIKNSRERIVPIADGFELADSNTFISTDEMNKLVDEFPERFSPNVILRPLHQQLVLPNIAYIGGGSEVAYWMQLKELFNNYNIHFPMLLLRTSAQIITKSQQEKLNKLAIPLIDIYKPIDELKKDFIARNIEIDLSLSEEKNELMNIFNQLEKKASQIDASLKNFVGAEGQKSFKGLDNISKRLIKAEKNSKERSMNQIDKTINQILPDGNLQERKENFLSFYVQYGSQFFDLLIDELNPFDQQFKLLEEQ